MKQMFKMRQQLSINFRYCYSSRRATQIVLTTRSSPTIGINLRSSLLSAVTACLTALPAKLSAFNYINSYMRQNAYRR